MSFVRTYVSSVIPKYYDEFALTSRMFTAFARISKSSVILKFWYEGTWTCERFVAFAPSYSRGLWVMARDFAGLLVKWCFARIYI